MKKTKEARERNNKCHNCGQKGHFAKVCRNEKVKPTYYRPKVEEFEPVRGLMNLNVPIM